MRKWHGSLDHGDPDSARYARVSVTIVTGCMVLLAFFLTSGTSAPVRFEHGGGTAAWIMGILVVPTVQELLQPQEL